MTVIDYYISLNSPWTYFGSRRLIELTDKFDTTINVKPVKIGELFANTGGLPLPKRSPERVAYRLAELKRWRNETGMEIVIEPAHFPADEAIGARAVIATSLAGENALAVSHEIGKALWEHNENIADEAVVDTACKRAGIDLATLLASGEDTAKLESILDQNTSEAISYGVFGVPTYRFGDGELFWGQDRLDFVEKKLRSLAT